MVIFNKKIEAARAGEAGKGFAVVATEVGNLSKNTQESLTIVQGVIERVQQNVADIIAQVDENDVKMVKQNEYFADVFASLQDMTALLKTSVDTISTMGDAYGKQTQVIKKTVAINQDIAESIQSENGQFQAINAMAENNASDTNGVATQAGLINDMVNQMNELLQRQEEG